MMDNVSVWDSLMHDVPSRPKWSIRTKSMGESYGVPSRPVWYIGMGWTSGIVL